MKTFFHNYDCLTKMSLNAIEWSSHGNVCIDAIILSYLRCGSFLSWWSWKLPSRVLFCWCRCVPTSVMHSEFSCLNDRQFDLAGLLHSFCLYSNECRTNLIFVLLLMILYWFYFQCAEKSLIVFENIGKYYFTALSLGPRMSAWLLF